MNKDVCEKILVTGGGISFNNQTPMTPSDDTPTEQKPKSANSRDYYCEVCETNMTGAVTYECHLAGARHLKNIENMKIGAPRDTGSMKRKTKGILPEVTSTKPGRAIFPATKAILDSCTKPLIGMNFITECQVSDGNFEPRYICQLCQGKCDPRTLLSHILGGKHRIAYFKEKYPDYYGEVFKDKTLRKSEVTPIIEKCAILVEKAEGRQNMKTIIDNDIIENCFTKTKAGTDVPFGGNRGRGNNASSRGFGSMLPRGRGQMGVYNGRGYSREGDGSNRGSRGGYGSSWGQGNGSSGRGQRGGGGQRGGYSGRGQKEFGGRGQVRGSRGGRGQRGSFSQSPRGGFVRGRGRGQVKYDDYGWNSDSYYDKGYSDAGYSDSGYGDTGYSDTGYSDTGYSDTGYGDMSGSQWYDESYYQEPGFGKFPSGRGGYAEPTTRYRPYPRSQGNADPYRRPYGSSALPQPPRPAAGNDISDSSALLSLTKCLVSNEDEAKAALQISNKLAEALLEYHRSKEPTQMNQGANDGRNSAAANPQPSMSGNVPAQVTGPMGVGPVKAEPSAYSAPQVDYNHGYGGNMDYTTTETTDASAQPYTGGYGYTQAW